MHTHTYKHIHIHIHIRKHIYTYKYTYTFTYTCKYTHRQFEIECYREAGEIANEALTYVTEVCSLSGNT
jgi:hypothetical protein